MAATALVVRIDDRQGVTVVDASETVGAGGFSVSRSTDRRLDVPISTLAPG